MTACSECNASLLEENDGAMGSGDNNLDCPTMSEDDVRFLDAFGVYIEGYAQNTIAVAGIALNVISSLLLGSREMRNPFNLLLIALGVFDSLYLLGSVLESFRKRFEPLSDLQTLLFPYLLYPGQMFSMSASIFMTVAVAMERYVAVHHPIDYSQAMNEANANSRRTLKYVVPTILGAAAFNVPKFFEAEIVYVQTDANSTRPDLRVTALRLDPTYTVVYNVWTRLVVLGLVPFGLLCFFNANIYHDIKRRRLRRPGVPRAQLSSTPINPEPRVRQWTSSLSAFARRPNHEDNLAHVLVGIVSFFLIAHFPRIFLGLHEALVLEETRRCKREGLNPIAVWVHLFTDVSHFLLVLNASVNSLIYCLLSTRFRVQLIKQIGALTHRIRQLGCSSKEGDDNNNGALNNNNNNNNNNENNNENNREQDRSVVYHKKEESGDSNNCAGNTDLENEVIVIASDISAVAMEEVGRERNTVHFEMENKKTTLCESEL